MSFSNSIHLIKHISKRCLSCLILVRGHSSEAIINILGLSRFINFRVSSLFKVFFKYPVKNRFETCFFFAPFSCEQFGSMFCKQKKKINLESTAFGWKKTRLWLVLTLSTVTCTLACIIYQEQPISLAGLTCIPIKIAFLGSLKPVDKSALRKAVWMSVPKHATCK